MDNETTKATLIDWEKDIVWFDPEEFDDPDYKGSWIYMNALTIVYLDRLRIKTKWPIITHNKFGIHGCVTVDPEGHSPDSRHYVKNACDAVDWHFDTDADPREQAIFVLKSEFTGIGIYYDWTWDGKKLQIGFHTDLRKRYQYWKREDGKYLYLLN